MEEQYLRDELNIRLSGIYSHITKVPSFKREKQCVLLMKVNAENMENKSDFEKERKF